MKEKTFGIPFAWSRRFSRQKTAAALATENTNNNTASRSTRRTASLFSREEEEEEEGEEEGFGCIHSICISPKNDMMMPLC